MPRNCFGLASRTLWIPRSDGFGELPNVLPVFTLTSAAARYLVHGSLQARNGLNRGYRNFDMSIGYGLIGVPSHQRFSGPSLKIAKCR